MQVHRSFHRRIPRSLRWPLALVAGGYALLLIPETEPASPAGAGKREFAWSQDAFWSELEKQFVAARRLSVPDQQAIIHGGLGECSRLLEAISGQGLAAEDHRFGLLESNLFRLAPVVAACPQEAPAYVSLMTRTREELKRQSIGWDLNSAIVRDRLYRLLFGARLALEEVMLQTAPGSDFPELIRARDEPSAAPAASLHGVTIHSGDILLSRGGTPTSALIARGNDYPGSFSHVALAHVDERTGRLSLVESHIECGVAVATPQEYLRHKKLRIQVLRLRSDLPALTAEPMAPHRAAAAALGEALRRRIPYDFAMDSRDHRAQFCSEVASAAYETVGIRLWMSVSSISSPTVVAWLGSLGVRHFETQEPADLEYDPQLCVVAEWRDRSALFRAHVDDAVTDTMLSAAAPGRPLPYNVWLLPVARVNKAFSWVLNAFGRTGPIPEGMSAATALRVRKYLEAHAASSRRVLVLAEEFKQQKGYLPPYWELLKLARQGHDDHAEKRKAGFSSGL